MHYRDYLIEELNLRKQAGGRYSQRSFAADLGVSPSFLNRVLSGERELSRDRAFDFSQRLGWDKKLTETFLNALEVSCAKNLAYREYVSKSRYTSNEAISIESFNLVADWHYGAIFELFSIKKNTVLTADYVAKRLGLQAIRAKLAFERLEELKLVKKTAEGYMRTKNRVKVKDRSSKFKRKYHRQMLEKAQEAIDAQPVEKRYYNGLTLAVNPQKLNEVADIFDKFKRQITEALQDEDNSEVYHLGIQLFQLTEPNHDCH